MSAPPRTLVVVPARDEEARIGACLRALAAQEGVPAGSWAVVLVLDACVDATATAARAAAWEAGLDVELLPGPERGVGHARALGMAHAARRLRGRPAGDGRARVIASTDADSVVAPDWLARTLEAVDGGAQAVGGRIELHGAEAATLPPAVLDARALEARRRLAAVREHAPGAEHHQFSGASLALTLAAYDAVGGLPAVAVLEDEALERALRAAGIPITYARGVRVTTSARTDGRVPRGLAQVLRTGAWRAANAAAPAPPLPVGSGDRGGRSRAPLRPRRSTDGVTRIAARDARGTALHRALPGAGELVLMLGPGVEEAAAAPLAAALRADPGLALVRAAEPHADPLAELVARPALNLHAPELAVAASPLTRTWAARRDVLERLALPHGDALDLTILIDVWVRHGLGAIAERPVACPLRAPRADAPLAAYELLAALASRLGEPPAASSAFADPAGTRRARLDEHPPQLARAIA